MIGWFMALSMGKRVAVGLGALIAIIGAIAALVIAVNSYNAAQRQAGRDEVMADWNLEKAARAQVMADFQTGIVAQLQPRFDQLGEKINGIDTEAARINLELPRALAADPRYIDPRCTLTAPVRDQINAARAKSSEN